MTKPWMYEDGVLTAREVMTARDGARLMWRAAWRFVRRRRRDEWASITPLTTHFAMENRTAEMLMRHHSATGSRAYQIANHITTLGEMTSRERSAVGYRPRTQPNAIPEGF